jgi:hypothetical protein
MEGFGVHEEALSAFEMNRFAVDEVGRIAFFDIIVVELLSANG